jgi:hypothetical protein
LVCSRKPHWARWFGVLTIASAEATDVLRLAPETPDKPW